MRSQKGQVLVELALILPFLLVLTFGLLDFGRLIYLKSTLVHAARSGARAAAITPNLVPVTTLSPISGDPSAVAKTVEKNIFDNMAKDEVQYRLRIFDTSGEVAGMAQPGNVVEVTVSWQNPPMLTPFWEMANQFFKGDSPPGKALTKIDGVSAMRYE